MESLCIPPQLELALHDAELTVGDRHPVRLALYLADGEVCLVARPLTGEQGPQAIVVAPRGVPGFTSSLSERPNWSMVDGLPPSWAAGADPFVALVGWVGEHAWMQSDGRAPPAPGSGERLRAQRQGAQLRDFVRRAAREGVRRCEPRARAVALRFAPCVRWRIYSLLLGDRTGRIGQLAQSAPGLLLFALALGEQPALAPVGSRVLASVVHGRRLTAVIDEALQGWAAALPDYLATEPPAYCEVWRRTLAAVASNEIAGAPGREHFLRQRLLIRRARARTAPTLLMLPPPLDFAPEDIPWRVRENARWFKVMKGTGATMSVHPTQDPAIAHGVSRFFSAHAARLPLPRGVALAEVVVSVSDFCQVHGMVPSRRSSAERLIAAALRHSRMDRPPPEVDPPRAVLAVELPPAEALDWSSPGLTVRRLRTVGDMHREARAMFNCLRQLVPEAMRGAQLFLHADIHGAPFDLALTGPPGARQLVALAGRANASATFDTLAALAPWIEAHHIHVPDELIDELELEPEPEPEPEPELAPYAEPTEHAHAPVLPANAG